MRNIKFKIDRKEKSAVLFSTVGKKTSQTNTYYNVFLLLEKLLKDKRRKSGILKISTKPIKNSIKAVLDPSDSFIGYWVIQNYHEFFFRGISFNLSFGLKSTIYLKVE